MGKVSGKTGPTLPRPSKFFGWSASKDVVGLLPSASYLKRLKLNLVNGSFFIADADHLRHF